MNRVVRSTLMALACLLAVHAPGHAQGHSYDPSADDAVPAVISYLRAHDVQATALDGIFPDVTSWQVKSPEGLVQELYVLRDGLTFVAGGPAPKLAASEEPGQPDVTNLGEVSPGVQGWVPRSWRGQSLDGVLYAFKGSPSLVKGYAYRLFPDRDIIDNLTAMQLLENSTQK